MKYLLQPNEGEVAEGGAVGRGIVGGGGAVVTEGGGAGTTSGGDE